jgi:hypothetical protein
MVWLCSRLWERKEDTVKGICIKYFHFGQPWKVWQPERYPTVLVRTIPLGHASLMHTRTVGYLSGCQTFQGWPKWKYRLSGIAYPNFLKSLMHIPFTVSSFLSHNLEHNHTMAAGSRFTQHIFFINLHASAVSYCVMSKIYYYEEWKQICCVNRDPDNLEHNHTMAAGSRFTQHICFHSS